MEVRKIKMGIKLKMILALLLLIVISVGGYGLYVLKAFHQDKQAYIFSTIGDTTERLSDQITKFVSTTLERVLLIQAIVQQEGEKSHFARQVFERYPALVALQLFADGSQDSSPLQYLQGSYLTQNQLKAQDLAPLLGPTLELNNEDKKIAVKPRLSKDYFLLELRYHHAPSKTSFRMLLNLQDLISEFRRSQAVANLLLTLSGELVLHPQDEVMARGENYAQRSFYPEILGFLSKMKIQTVGTKVFTTEAGEERLVSYTKNPALDLVVISYVGRAKAFEALEKLIKDSIAFGVLMVGIAALVGTFLAAGVTRPVQRLMEGTRRISQGDYKTPTVVTSSDELGVLSDSFNYMAKEIVRYTNEIQEKARMANELAVAQLVQNSFFPGRDATVGDMTLSGYYTPASECGGDWWGYKHIDDKVLLFIGDATGHGVPAALITATANCCVNLLEDLAQHHQEIMSSPGEILRLLNKVIYAVGGKILMTFFVAIYDLKDQKIRYANASHNVPYLYRPSGEAPSKNDVDVLLSEVGPRLGHKAQADYPEEERTLRPGDALLFCTDGMIEGVNPAGKMYGERRFIKSFAQYAPQGPKKVIEGLLIDANNFYEGVPVDDDITLLAVQIQQST